MQRCLTTTQTHWILG